MILKLNTKLALYKVVFKPKGLLQPATINGVCYTSQIHAHTCPDTLPPSTLDRAEVASTLQENCAAFIDYISNSSIDPLDFWAMGLRIWRHTSAISKTNS